MSMAHRCVKTALFAAAIASLPGAVHAEDAGIASYAVETEVKLVSDQRTRGGEIRFRQRDLLRRQPRGEADDVMLRGIARGQNRCDRRARPRRRRIGIAKDRSPPRHVVQKRRQAARIPVRPKPVGAQRVDDDEHDVRRPTAAASTAWSTTPAGSSPPPPPP